MWGIRLVVGYLFSFPLPPTILVVVGRGADGGIANLALSLLTHLHTPHPDVPKLEIEKPPMLFLSPWLTFSQSASTFTTNELLDVMPLAGLRRFAAAFLGSSPR